MCFFGGGHRYGNTRSGFGGWCHGDERWGPVCVPSGGEAAVSDDCPVTGSVLQPQRAGGAQRMPCPLSLQRARQRPVAVAEVGRLLEALASRHGGHPLVERVEQQARVVQQARS